jgi:DNA-binding transcriptional MerR regulator
MPGPQRSDDTYFQIGEAAERTGLTQRTLRYYEEKGLLHAPERMEGGFRLYSQEDIERLERIKELKDLLGFSLADIKEMLDAEDVRLQIKAEWRKDADAAEKAARIRVSREMTLKQLALVEEKLTRMAAMRDELAERIKRYDSWLLQWAEESQVAKTPS